MGVFVCLFTYVCVIPLSLGLLASWQDYIFKSRSLVHPLGLQTALSSSTAASGHIRPMMLSPSNGAEREDQHWAAPVCSPINYPFRSNFSSCSLICVQEFCKTFFSIHIAGNAHLWSCEYADCWTFFYDVLSLTSTQCWQKILLSLSGSTRCTKWLLTVECGRFGTDAVVYFLLMVNFRSSCLIFFLNFKCKQKPLYGKRDCGKHCCLCYTTFEFYIKLNCVLPPICC